MDKVKISPYHLTFFYEQELNPDRYDYNISFIQKINGPLDISRLSTAIKKIVSEYFIYHCLIIEENGEYFWSKSNELPALEVYQSTNNTQIENFVKAPFYLKKKPACRFGLFKIREEENILAIIVHHILIDGNKFKELIDAIESYYNKFYKEPLGINEQKNILNILNRNYIQTIVSNKEANTYFWVQHLKGSAKNLKVPSQTNDKLGNYSIYNFVINLKTFSFLNKNLKLEKISDFNIFFTVFAYLIHRYTHESIFSIPYPININLDKTNDIYEGASVNTIFAKFDFTEDQTFTYYLKQRIKNIEQELKNSKLPVYKIHQAVNIKLSNIGFAQTNLKNKPLYINDCNTDILYDFYYDTGGNQIAFEYESSNSKIYNFRIKYTKSYTDEFIKNLSNNFIYLLEQCLKSPDTKLSKHQICNQQEYNKIVYEWNRTEAPYPKDKTIHQLFEEQVERTPDNTAVVFENQKLSYRELNEKANQLAHTLRKEYKAQWKEEIKGDTLIGIYIEQSLEMIIGILGILKSGAAYVPFDTNEPEERLKYKINDCNCKFVLTSKQYINNLLFLSDEDTIPLTIDMYDFSKSKTTNPKLINKSGNLAYVIYTSGTTGKPKGVTIEHKSVLNFLNSLNRIKSMTNNFNGLLVSNITFDVSVHDIFSVLLYGGSLYLTKISYLLEKNKFYSYLRKNKISSLYLPPFTFSILLEELPNNQNELYLERVLVGVEPIKFNLLKKILNLSPNMVIINGYGPTEATICSSFYKIHKRDSYNLTPIGKPLDNTLIYLLGSYMDPVPIGVTGELYLGGDGLSRGYLNRFELTKEKFISNPFVTEDNRKKGKNLKIYKTGDICRYLPDGKVEFIGRTDNQIKLRGFRIELEEIEHALKTYPALEKVACTLNKNGKNEFITAYYSLNKTDDKLPNSDQLIGFLKKKLPDYMIPSKFIYISKFPLNNSGKIDDKLLPEPTFDSKEINYIAPVTENEKLLCKIWHDILNIDKVGLNDNFFKLGGNSISAIKAVNRINTLPEFSISIKDLFENPTVSKILVLKSNKYKICISKAKIKIFPLSFSQERLFFIDRFEQGTNAYNIPLLLKLKPEINTDSFIKSIKTIVNRHEVLRTTFIEKEGEYFQKVNNEQLIANSYKAGNKNEFSSISKKLINHIFSLKNEYPIKVDIIEYESDTYVSIVIHHIAFDGWSTDIFINELSLLYDQYTNNAKNRLSKLKIQYKDFAYWQRCYLSGDVLKIQSSFWEKQLKYFETLNLPTDNLRPANVSYKGDDYTFNIESQLSEKLRSLASEKNTTLYNVLLSAFYVLLYKYTQQNDLILGTPSAGRHYKQLENLIGFFVNSLPLRIKIDDNESINSLIDKSAKTSMKAQKYQDLPFEKLVEVLNIEKDMSRHPVFQVMFSVQSFNSDINTGIYDIVDISDFYKIAKFDLTLFIDDSKNEFRCLFNYSTGLFNRDTIKRMAGHYLNIIKTFIKNSDKKIDDIQILSEEEYNKIVYEWNRTEAPYPKDKTIHQLFEEQVERTPDNTAVVFEDKKLTYRELNEKANQLTHTLRKEYKEQWKEEIKGDTLIGIYIERSLEMIIGILGILKSGAAYVPFDTNEPEERLKFKINDCKCKFVLTSKKCVNNLLFLSDEDTIPLTIDMYDFSESTTTNPESINKPDNLVYVIYTSGSTGKPKGVMIEHKSLVNFIYNISNKHKVFLKKKFSFLSFTNYCFDIFGLELWGSLINSGTIILASTGLENGFTIKEQMNNFHPEIVQATPSLLSTFINEIKEMPDSLFIIGGEPLTKELTNKVLHISKNCWNYYGPTETTIWSTSFKLEKNKKILIGTPLPNQTCYILDNNLNPTPIGIKGNLYIGGLGLSSGYYKQVKLTKDSFIPNPFKKNEKDNYNLKIYKTGDSCRYLPSGNIEFIGRTDNQIKIRGFRVELGEIENLISEHPAIEKVVCTFTKDKENEFISTYYSLNKTINEALVDSSQIIDFLKKKLPDYMIPTSFIYIKEFPFNNSGKIDMVNLPEPILNTQGSKYTPPGNEIEKNLCEIWQQVLNIKKVGINNDFFELGGNSILAMKAVNKIISILKISISISDFLKYNKISLLSDYIIKRKKKLSENEIIEF